MVRNNYLATILFCAVILSAPIQWQRIVNIGGLSLASFHIFSFLFCFSIFLNKKILRSIKLSQIIIICSALFYYLFLLFIASVFVDGHYDFRDLIRQIFYIVTSLSVGFYLSATKFHFRNVNMVVFTISLAPFLLIFLMWLAISEARDPMDTLVMAISGKDPDLLIRQIFGAAIRSGEENLNSVQASLRHQISGAILAVLFFNIAIFIANYDLLIRSSKLFFFASVFLSVIVIAASMSRSIILAGIVAYMVHLVFTIKFKARFLLYIMAVSICGIFVLFGPIGEMLYTRILGNTTSYSVRIDNTSSAFQSIDNNIIFGMLSKAESSHNLIIDFWMVFGIFGLISSTFLIGSLVIRSYVVGFIGYQSHSAILKLGCIAVNLPLIRWMTASRGQLSFPEWLCIGLVLACIMLNERSNRCV